MKSRPPQSGLGPRPPRQRFMTLRDIAFWIRSAHADARLARLRQQHGDRRAFDLLYEQMDDPWGSGLAQYRYQRLKYDVLLSLLPERRYYRALDLGCGRGEMVRRLAPYVDEVLGLDLSTPAIDQARSLSTHLPNVRFDQADVLALDPALFGCFDLVILADTLYYLSPLHDSVLKHAREQTAKLLAPGGLLLLANHFFFSCDLDSRISRTIHDSFRWTTKLQLDAEHRRPFYLVSLLRREDIDGN